MTDDGIRWTENGNGRLAHVGGPPGYGLYVGYVADYEDGKGWRWEWMLGKRWDDKQRFVGSRQAGMKAIRRRWRAFLARGGLEPIGTGRAELLRLLDRARPFVAQSGYGGSGVLKDMEAALAGDT